MRKIAFIIIIAFLRITTYAQIHTFNWAESAGGSATDLGLSIATDVNGNVFATGYFKSPTIAFGTFLLNNKGVTNTADIFIVKFDPNGNVLWAKGAGGAAEDRGQCISTDKKGNVFLSGFFQSSSIIIGSDTLTNAGGRDIFITKYDSNGNIIGSKRTGGTADDYAMNITTDAYGNLITTGFFLSPMLTMGTTTLTNSGLFDIFVAKYDTTGNVLWAKSAGSSSNDYARGISTDANGNIYITGGFESSTISFGATTLSNASGSDIYIAKYDANGNSLWAKNAIGTTYDSGESVATDNVGHAFVTGYFQSPMITFGTDTIKNAGASSVFIVKYDENGNVIWAKNTKSSSGNSGPGDYGHGITTDTSGNAYVIGGFTSLTIDCGVDTLNNAGDWDVFINKYNENGDVIWAKSIGGATAEEGYGIATDVNNNIVIAGYFQSPTINLGQDTLSNSGGRDFFVAKLSTPSITWISQHKNSNIKIYPNPTTNIISIEGLSQVEKSEITIYDIQGKLMLMKEILENGTIDLSDFIQGVYMIRIGDVVQRIVKM